MQMYLRKVQTIQIPSILQSTLQIQAQQQQSICGQDLSEEHARLQWLHDHRHRI